VVSATTATPIFIDSPAQPRGRDSHHIYVIFTDTARTKTALLAAARLARGLGLPLELLTAQIVPYPLPLNEPPVSIDFVARAMSRLVADLEADISVRILLCRDADETLRNAVRPDALVVIGGGRPKLTRLLQSDGRRLIVIH
jgi:hypothetical protein